MGMVPVGGWEAQNSREKSAHEGRQLIARSAYTFSALSARLIARRMIPPHFPKGSALPLYNTDTNTLKKSHHLGAHPSKTL